MDALERLAALCAGLLPGRRITENRHIEILAFEIWHRYDFEATTPFDKPFAGHRDETVGGHPYTADAFRRGTSGGY